MFKQTIEWTHSSIHGKYIIDRWTTNLLYIGELKVERTNATNYKFEKTKTIEWKLVCLNLNLDKNLFVQNEKEAQEIGLEIVKQMISKILDSLNQLSL